MLELAIVPRGATLVLRPEGRLDSAHAFDFEQKVLALLSRSECHWAVDLAGIEYLSSAGLRVLLMMAKRLRARSGALVLFAAGEAVLEVLEVAGFTRVLPLAATLEEALARLPAGDRPGAPAEERSAAPVAHRPAQLAAAAAALLGVETARPRAVGGPDVEALAAAAADLLPSL